MAMRMFQLRLPVVELHVTLASPIIWDVARARSKKRNWLFKCFFSATVSQTA